MANIPFKGIALAAAVAVGGLALSKPAEARSNVPGIIAGIAVGAIIAGAARSHHRHHYGYHGPKRHHRSYYYQPAPRYYSPPPPVYYGPPVRHSYAPAPWTPDWYAYCASKFRSFDARSGTYQPYHGPRRLCR